MALTPKKFVESRFPFVGDDDLQLTVELSKKIPETIANLGNQPGGFKHIRSNTTVFSIIYDAGVITAGDRRTSENYYGIFSDSTVKVHELTKFSKIAFAGDCNTIRALLRNMESICNTWEADYNKVLSPDGQKNYLSLLVQRYWMYFQYTGYFDIGVPILAAYDVRYKRPRIFAFDINGYPAEKSIVVGTGCGFDCVENLIIDGWRKNLTEEAAVELAVKAMYYSGLRSSGVSDSRLVPPTIAKVDASGFAWIESKKVAKLVKKVDSEVRRNQS